MATLKTATDRPRQLPKSRFWPRLLSFLTVSALTLAPIAALTLWLLISDAELAAAVMEEGDLLPVVKVLAKIVGKAVASMLAML
jgi:hypothetical protein